MLTETEATKILETADLFGTRDRPQESLRLLRQLLKLVAACRETWVADFGLRMYRSSVGVHDELHSRESGSFLLELVRWLRTIVDKFAPQIRSVAEPVLSCHEAKLLCECGFGEEGIACYRSSLAHLEKVRPQADEWELSVRCEFASRLFDTNRLQELRDMVDVARVRSNTTSKQLAALSIMQGNAAILTKDLEAAETAYQAAHDLSRKLNEPVEQGKALERISLAHKHAAKEWKLKHASLNVSISARQRAIALYQDVGDSAHELEARTQLIHTLVDTNQADRAIQECIAAKARCVSFSDPEAACAYIAQAGHIAEVFGRKMDAVGLYRDALEQYGHLAPSDLVTRVRQALRKLSTHA